MDKEHPKRREKYTATKFSVHGLSFCAQFAKVSIFLLIFDNQDAMMVNDTECFQRNWM